MSMTSPPTSPKAKRGVRSYIREQYGRLVRSHSRSPSQQSIEVIDSDTGFITPLPTQGSTSTFSNFLAPPSSKQAAILRHARSDSQISPNLNPNSTKHTGSSSRSVIWVGLRTGLQELQKAASLFHPLESAVSGLIACVSLMEGVSKNRSEYEEMASELKTLTDFLTRHINESGSIRMSGFIANVAIGIQQEVQLINEKQNRSLGGRLLEAAVGEDEVIKHYRRIGSLFRQLQTDANLSTWSIANEVLANARLEGLNPAKLANYDSMLSMETSRRTCTEGTRMAVLSEMNDWSANPHAPDLYLMSGMAGTGKTTIACSFANVLEERKQLAASFFCTRTSPECRQVNRIVSTIAYQLARYSIPFQSALCQVLGSDPDIGTKNLVKQFERLLKEPLSKVKEAIPENLVVVIDALDECDDRYGVKVLLELLFKFAPGLPLKFFVTSRPEPEIYQRMIFRSSSARTIFHLHEIEKSLVQADIELYLNEELQSVSPTPSQINQLAQRAGNLFIYAATLVRYIQPLGQPVDPQQRLQFALEMDVDSTKQNAEIDALYTAILESALNANALESREAENVQLVLHAALCAQEPVGVETLAALTGISDSRQVASALQPLRSVLHFSENTGLVSTLHASFPDFMFNQERSGKFYFTVAECNQLLAHRCFEVMKQQLRFNICNLGSSFVPDAKVKDLAHRMDESISAALSYACRYWGDHIGLAASSGDLCELLSEFLCNQLLFWMEVLSLKRDIVIGTEALTKVKIWLQARHSSSDLTQLAEDAKNFVMSYNANPVSRCTPHIYLSALPLCPPSSLVFKHYRPRTRGLIELKGSGMSQRGTAALASWSIGSPLRSISYSPDGSRIAFGCADGTVGIRNAHDGTSAISPFKAHADVVWSVAFSPDGTRFISGSNDHTVKIWNAQDGTPAGEPFQGHTGAVYSVLFSPDGRLIASGSADKTIRIWSANNSAGVAEIFTGHTSWVWSIAFSPDSTRIVSGSFDHTIRVWNIQDGTLAFDPLKGHTGTVWSVAFSPDGTRIVSSSADATIRIWGAQDGAPILGPLEGHTNEIFSAVFSPDGTRLVTGSRDATIRVWSSKDGSLIAGPLEGHTDVVWSVAFSPDGMRIISGSGDHTIRVWNSYSSTITSSQFNGHSHIIWSVAFSPDGTHFVTSSGDATIRIWACQDGTHVVGPLKGHTKRILSVAYSPDGTRIASGSDDETIRLWSSHDGTPISTLKGHTGPAICVAFSPDGTRVASGSTDQTVRVWRLHDGASDSFEGHTNVVHSVAFSSDGKYIASGSYDQTIRIWGATNGKLIADPSRGHTDHVRSVAFSPDGKLIVSGANDFTVRLWRASDGSSAADPLTGHTASVIAVAFSPDGTCVVSGSGDRTVRIWNIHNRNLIAGPLYGHAHWVTSVAFAPDGMRVASSSRDYTIRMWDVHHSSPIVTDPSSTRHTCTAISTIPEEWIVEDEWVTDKDGQLLFWVPPEVLRSLLTPHCKYVISRFGSIEVDMSCALLGEDWIGCYVSE
ncbi:hypothetical protein CTheo_2985 [Ceratobasidium theobromae]|uniref:NACHT domain-containing protein n=1 Tax=Ceratobasidium theobromae TaxID=1582974 RepID=A0A5N5QR10_9AGAM|nr:hypothetical protein CTheo_2985 [Ceratobasidium theobromae]